MEGRFWQNLWMLILGCAKYVQILLLGPRNAVNQNQNLLERTQCTKLLYSLEMVRVVEVLQRTCFQVTAIEIQSLDALLSMFSQRFNFDKTFAEAHKDPILVIHSSGSTGRI